MKRNIPRDGNKTPILGAGTNIYTFKTAVAQSAWTAITLPSGVDSKNIRFGMRDNNAYRLGHESGSGYTSIGAQVKISIALVAEASTTLFYVYSPDSADTFEVLVVN